VALTAYLKLSGARTGTVQGSVTQKGREGKIAVIAVSHEIVSPRDPAFTIRLSRAELAGIDMEMPNNTRPDLMSLETLDEWMAPLA
jgi:type VI protein secretion system component Hcp